MRHTQFQSYGSAVFATAAAIVLAEIILVNVWGAPRPDRERYSWEMPHARVLPTGNLEWAPEPFVFEKGASVRYIDFESGSDTNTGMSKDSAWKHHPWDKAATASAGACSGVHAYVFKGGVTYRGSLTAPESGRPDDPIRLTKDPAWGDGNPVFSGATTIAGGWKKANASAAPGMPRPDRLWYIDLGMGYDGDPSSAKITALWQVDGDRVERLHIARTPNYDDSDLCNPIKYWPKWQRVDVKNSTFYSPVVKELKGTAPDELKDVVIWATTPSLMGSAYPRSQSKATWDLDAGSIRTGSLGKAHDWERHRNWNYFMLEDAAVLLDTPGEFFFDRKGQNAGRLYLWPAGDVDPNTVKYEVAQRKQLIGITDKSNIVISGLEFRYNDGDDGQRRDYTRHNTRASHCILAVGSCSNIAVKNCVFYYVADAFEARLHKTPGRGGSPGAVMDNINFSDNDIRDASGAGVVSIMGVHKHQIFPKGLKHGWLGHVEVMRNRLRNTGFRGSLARWDSLPAVEVSYPETCEIAGNIIAESMGIGIITYGGKASIDHDRSVPLVRYLIHHNQLDNTMRGANDYGGLEHFQGGPTYIYNNVSRNAVGNRSFWNHPLGYNLYLDGGFKCYSFNNILSGMRPGEPGTYGHCGYFMVFGFLNQFFNNTLYHFTNGMDGSSGNRSNILGNLISDCEDAFIRQNRSGDHSMLGGGDTGEMGRMGIPTMAYDHNVFHGHPKEFGEVAGTQGSEQRKAPVVKGATLAELKAALEDNKCRLSGLGWQVDAQPMTAPTDEDYRPVANGGATGRGVKYFVPWSLAHTVGEWNFLKHTAVPNIVLGEHFYMTKEHMGRGQYYHIPRMDLMVSGAVSADDYIDGPLEDWVDGALCFDGMRTATLSHADMKRDVTYPGSRGMAGVTYDGSKRETVDMATNNFALEVYFKTEAKHIGGALVSKVGPSAGYEVSIAPAGTACLTLTAAGASASAASSVRVNDGQWHHLLVEVDRDTSRISFYVDGQAAGQGTTSGIGARASLSNTSDFVVGKGLHGAVDFLRICRSTLAESKTTMAELYAWEFDGPHLHNFNGRATANSVKRDAGAI